MSAVRWIRFRGSLSALFLVLAVIEPLRGCTAARAQDKPAMSAAPAAATPSYSGGVVEINGAVMEIKAGDPQGGYPAATPGPMPTGPDKPGEAAAKPKPGGPGQPPGQPPGKPDDAKGKEAITPVHRPAAPAKSPNRDEFKIRPDPAGKVRLCFTDQPWQPVLEWLATISGMSLDWQELPGDSLNLTTRRSYTVPEVRDLINQHLLARGFTLLCHGEVLSVAEIKKLDPSLVPRVEPADLAKRDPHEFVKVSFPLEMFSAEAAKSELNPMLSPNGKLFALNETSRLEAIDAVLNLRDIEGVLRQQQARASQPKTFREFKLKYARAEEVHKLLATLVTSDSPAMPGMPGQPGMNPQQAAMMAQAQMQGGGQPGQPQPNPAAAAKDAAVTIAVNARNNSLLVQARGDKMAKIAQVIEAIDIPADPRNLSLANMGRMQIYRLSGIDPEPVVKTLMDVGNLDPSTRLEVDKRNSAIIAFAPLADHVTIRALVDKLTGSDRKFEVIRLHRLAADHVAGTIDFMLGSGSKKDQQRRPWYYDSPQEDKSKREFRVEADVEHNRLLLWSNTVELAEIEALLVKLGEIPAAGSGSTMRVIDSGDAKETEELLKRIQSVWPSIAPNALQTPAAGAAAEKVEPAAGPKPAKAAGAAPAAKAPQTTSAAPGYGAPAQWVGSGSSGKSASSGPLLPHRFPGRGRSPVVRFTNAPGEPMNQPLDDRTPAVRLADGAKSAPPPVKITVGPDGKLIISSQDSQALDLLEQLVAEMPAARKDYRIFQLKYAMALTVALNLEDFFKEKKENADMPWYFDFSPPDDSQDDRRLSKRPKLKFISDVDTNTILVEGANPRQMKTIEELVQIYDQPPPSDSQSVRKTELIHLKYSKAKVVADTIKDVYRDLLSANDKALAENNQRGPRNVYNFGGSDTDSSGAKTPHFKGLLSIGVDETSNSVMVSAPAFLFDHVAKMVQELDKAASPEYEVRVVRIGPSISPDRVKDILDEVYNHKSDKAAEKPGAEKPAAGKPSNGSRSGGRNRSQQQQ